MNSIDLSKVDHQTLQKTQSICEKDGFHVTGFTLANGAHLYAQNPQGAMKPQRCIVDMSAVRWASPQELFEFLHPDGLRLKQLMICMTLSDVVYALTERQKKNVIRSEGQYIDISRKLVTQMTALYTPQEIEEARRALSQMANVSDKFSAKTLELARQVLERRANDTRTDEQKIQDGVKFIIGEGLTGVRAETVGVTPEPIRVPIDEYAPVATPTFTGTLVGRWRPISEAPRDGQTVLLCEWQQPVGKIKGYFAEIDTGYWGVLHEEDGECWLSSKGMLENPTHFMPNFPEPQ